MPRCTTRRGHRGLLVIRPDEPRQGDGLAVRKDLETVAGARGVARNSIFPGESRRAGQRSPVPPLADVVARHPHEWKPALGLRQRAHPAPRGLAHRPETHGPFKTEGGAPPHHCGWPRTWQTAPREISTSSGRSSPRRSRPGGGPPEESSVKKCSVARRRRPVAVGTMQPRA